MGKIRARTDEELAGLPRLDPANAASVDVEQVKKMVDRFIEKGFTYFGAMNPLHWPQLLRKPPFHDHPYTTIMTRKSVFSQI